MIKACQKATAVAVFFITLGVSSASGAGDASVSAAKRVPSPSNGPLTVGCNDTGIHSLLEDIAVAAQVQIYLFDSLGQERISFHMSSDVHEILRRVLRDYNYAIVYCSDGESEPGIVVMSKNERLEVPQSGRDRVYKQKANSTRNDGDQISLSHEKKRIEAQIKNLEARLASGRSDEVYERWKEIRGKDFTTHDSQRLRQLRRRLSVLSQRN